MNDPLDNLLDARLRDETPYIDDAGFTARVMQQLPRRRFSWSTQRAFIIFVANDCIGRHRLFRIGRGDVRARCVCADVGSKTGAIASSDSGLWNWNDHCRALGCAYANTRHDRLSHPERSRGTSTKYL
jgi:hypothetical protein